MQMVDARLRYALRLIGKWEDVKQDLTARTWLRAEHTWQGGALEDQRMDATRTRLDQVLKMKEVYNELFKLLNADEVQALQLEGVFVPFLRLNPLHCSVYTDPLWATAKADFEQRMVPIEKRISQKLRELFGSVLVPALAAAVNKHGDRGELPGGREELAG